jgi:hypothetical protein
MDNTPLESRDGDGHGHVGIDGLHSLQPIPTVAHELQLCPELCARHAVVGLLKVNKAGPELVAALAAATLPLLAVALDGCAQCKDCLLCAAASPEAELPLGVLASCLCVV